MAPGTPPNMPPARKPMTPPPRAVRPAMIFIMICSGSRSSQLKSTSLIVKYMGSVASWLLELPVCADGPLSFPLLLPELLDFFALLPDELFPAVSVLPHTRPAG